MNKNIRPPEFLNLESRMIIHTEVSRTESIKEEKKEEKGNVLDEVVGFFKKLF